MRNPSHPWRVALSVAFPHTLPVLTGFLVLGIAYGILMQAKGYGPLYSISMSAIAFCGSMQFVAVTLLTTAFDPLQAFLLSIMVNARHICYGLSMLKQYRGMGKWKPFLIYTLCDETFSITASIKPPQNIKPVAFYVWIALLDYIYWVLGTAIGAILGQFIHLDLTGLDFVLTALFVVLLLEKWKKPENRKVILTGLCCTSICLIFFGSNQVVIPSMALITCVLLIGRNRTWFSQTPRPLS